MFDKKEERIAKRANREKRREERRQVAQERREERARIEREKAAERERLAQERAALERKRKREQIEQELNELKQEREYYASKSDKELLVEIVLLIKGHMIAINELKEDIEKLKNEFEYLEADMQSNISKSDELDEIKRVVEEIKMDMSYNY